MITIKIDTKKAEAALAKAAKQIPFAVATAVNTTARQAARDVNSAMPSVFQHTNPFTRMATGVPTLATKASLTAIVAIKPLQAKYLGLEIFGGTRTSANNTRLASSALVLPGKGSNPLPTGFLARISQQAAAEVARRQQIAAGMKKRRKGSNNSGVFKMSGKGPVGGPGGFFRRLPDHHLVRLVSFEASAHYRAKFNFVAAVETSVNRNFRKNLEDAIAKALATAR